MAAKYARATGGNWNTDSTWSTTSGGAADTTAPTAADDCFLDASSGNVTIAATAVGRSLNCTGYTGTLTHNASITLSLGDATAGASNIALKMVAGMTYTLGNATSSAISFITTSATVQTIDFAGKTTGNVTFNATSNGSWQYTGAHTTTGTVTLTKGTLDVNGQTCSWGLVSNNSGSTRTLTFGAAAITITGSGNTWAQTTTGLTFNPNTSTVTFTNANATLNAGGSTFNDIVFSIPGTGTVNIGSAVTCANMTLTASAVKTNIFKMDANITVTGTFTANGSSAINRLLIYSGTTGTARTITAATVSVTNADFQDITGAGAGSWDLSAITGGSGDCGGNSGITFTTAATQTYTGGTDNWSTAAKWTSRVPLPQDNVSMSGVTGGTITADMPRLGKSIDWTGASGSPTWTNSVTSTSYGDWTSDSGVTYQTTNTHNLAGRSSLNITSNGSATCPRFIIGATTASNYTFVDALTYAGTVSFQFLAGTLTANGNVTLAGAFVMAVGTGLARTLNMGSGVWTFTTTAGTFWSNLATSLITINPGTAEIKWNTATASTLTFAGGTLAGGSYPTLTYTVAGSTGKLTITGSNSFAQINFSDTTNARTLEFTAATTTTIRNTNGFNVQGTSGKLMTVQSVTAATHTLSSTNTQSCDYLNIINSIATGGGSWYAGANSTDGTGNTGWIFAAAPPQVAGSPARQSLRNLQNLMSL